MSGKTVLDWTATDTDNQITGYDIYLGTTIGNMAITTANLTQSIANDIMVTSGITYYWKVVTKDSKGNSPTSETYSFKVYN